MSGFYRSKPMKYYNLLIPRESAWDVMNELGALESIHFVDYDTTLPMINRPFANYIKRCDDTLNKIELMQVELKKYKKPINYCQDVDWLLSYYKNTLARRDKASHTYYEELENEVEKQASFLFNQTNSQTNLQEQLNRLIEYRAVLKICNQMMGQAFFQEKPNGNGNGNGTNAPIDMRGKGIEEVKGLGVTLRFNQVVGVINKEDEQRFKRMIFRVTKGNIWMNIVDIEQPVGRQQIIDPVNNKPIFKAIYVLVFPGGDGQNNLKVKLQRISESFGSGKYEFPSSQGEFLKKVEEIEQQINETSNLLSMTVREIGNHLDHLSRNKSDCNCSYIEQVKLYVMREKYLYSNLNYLRMQGSIFCGNFWLPEGLESQVENILRNIGGQGGDKMPGGQIQESKIAGNVQPPTYFKLNEFTWVFQEIVNTYGIPRYQEINPGLFTVTTFPFLFGVMFADIGHGFLLLLMGVYLCLNNQSLKKGDSLLKAMLPARHMLLMMGFFAFYNGFIYNDYLSLSLNLFGSCFKLDDVAVPPVWIPVDATTKCVYPFGIDPVWSMTGNQLTFQNGYKMKLAVIIAVIHMSCGIMLKGVNSVYFRNWIDFFCEFLPQILFMVCTFGLMDFMVIYKWLNVYEPANAPSIITLLIGLVLTPFVEPLPPLWNPQSELLINQVCIAIALICVPVMLIPKPFLLQAQFAKLTTKSQSQTSYKKVTDATTNQPLLNQKRQQSDRHSYETDNDFGQDLEKAAHHPEIEGESHQSSEHHDFGEIFVHQVIETIEFVLGSISNTASYLRLWALSLAHGQLAEVFFNMTLAGFVREGGVMGGLKTIVSYTIFALVTFGVLMLMDVMECFLHALRLHWVEFQNKFFKADGYAFVAFSYSKVIRDNAAPKEQ